MYPIEEKRRDHAANNSKRRSIKDDCIASRMVLISVKFGYISGTGTVDHGKSKQGRRVEAIQLPTGPDDCQYLKRARRGGFEGSVVW